MSKKAHEAAAGRPRLVVIGVGLMGGSLAAALRKARFAGEVVGVDENAQALKTARALGLIDAVRDLEAAVAKADLVVLATPLGAIPGLLTRLAPHLPAHALVTDMGSAKESIAASARALGLTRFVPGHPMAGGECSGPGAARADLFADRNVILTPTEITDEDAVQAVRAMWVAAGAQVVCADAATHDRLVAYTSHLPHLLAFACAELLAEFAPAEALAPFTGAGLKDFLRIAGSDPVMWRDICTANAAFLAPALAAFGQCLAGYGERLARGDFEGLLSDFTKARAFRGDLMQRTAHGEH
ncbi:prephenate dehydrogenase/arogenate dehydrogenase family protein [Acidiferrobacter sp.]|uniref:prephenate dehydrogenase n=1 Tax=Acidiferrobacter sp. TaxID=1872107 RepID=UPI00263247D7|nr:prephenate dehydrogenase/arogenate dehydrogenase family protein [Acidiferrobacter sp.]